jgi:serine/tyrosine/threonine adenylyltransferase
MLDQRPKERAPQAPRLRIPGWVFSNSYSTLPARFFARLDPLAVVAPRLVKLNAALASELGLECGSLDGATLAAIFSGNSIPEGADPIALAYAGHQFGQFVPQLGDGRAILLGEVRDRGGVRRDIQFKGSGRTPWSRNGDGRAALGPVLREYIVSEAMHALGIPTTRSLAAVSTGETVFRERALPGAIVTRIAASHVRVGTFEYFAARHDQEAVRLLADYVIARHYGELASADRPYLELLRAVCRRQAALIAAWMRVGFIHGVMNTDNTAISGETIDFGPCAFMDAYDPAAVFSSIDAAGRYAFANQPPAAQWNLARFAETLLALIDPDPERAIELASAEIDDFAPRFSELWLDGMRRKFGLLMPLEDDLPLIRGWLDAMHRNECDYTRTFRRLCECADPDVEAGGADAALRGCFAHADGYQSFVTEWRARLGRESERGAERAAAMRRANPMFIARNHRIEQVITAATEQDDFAPFEELVSVLSRPYESQPQYAAYTAPPQPEERVLRTFCGT